MFHSDKPDFVDLATNNYNYPTPEKLTNDGAVVRSAATKSAPLQEGERVRSKQLPPFASSRVAVGAEQHLETGHFATTLGAIVQLPPLPRFLF